MQCVDGEPSEFYVQFPNRLFGPTSEKAGGGGWARVSGPYAAAAAPYIASGDVPRSADLPMSNRTLAASPGWVEHTDTTTGCVYFFHDLSGTTRWAADGEHCDKTTGNLYNIDPLTGATTWGVLRASGSAGGIVVAGGGAAREGSTNLANLEAEDTFHADEALPTMSWWKCAGTCRLCGKVGTAGYRAPAIAGRGQAAFMCDACWDLHHHKDPTGRRDDDGGDGGEGRGETMDSTDAAGGGDTGDAGGGRAAAAGGRKKAKAKGRRRRPVQAVLGKGRSWINHMIMSDHHGEPSVVTTKKRISEFTGFNPMTQMRQPAGHSHPTDVVVHQPRDRRLLSVDMDGDPRAEAKHTRDGMGMEVGAHPGASPGAPGAPPAPPAPGPVKSPVMSLAEKAARDKRRKALCSHRLFKWGAELQVVGVQVRRLVAVDDHYVGGYYAVRNRCRLCAGADRGFPIVL